jgi:ABC-type multidrug transport system fused ATPase/permease subunit
MLLNRHAFIFKSKPKTWLAGIMEALKQVISDTLRPLSLAFISLPRVCPRSGRKQLLIRVVSTRRSMFLDQVGVTPDPAKSLRPRVSDTVDAISETQPIQGVGRPQDAILSKLGIFDQTVDPSSPSFNFERWSHIIFGLRSKLDLPTPPHSGFAFKKLTVHGGGPAVEQQDTVWALLTSLLNFRAWFRPKHSKTILQDLDGVVQKGELLLVLGRPGSGCTTFLKTITGEMRSLELDSASVLHYTGASKTKTSGAGALTRET